MVSQMAVSRLKSCRMQRDVELYCLILHKYYVLYG